MLRLPAFLARPLTALFALALAACGQSDDGTLDIAAIGEPEALFSDGVMLSNGAQHLRAASRSGLVALDAGGNVIPALADRWNVVDEGTIYVFRLREGSWPDGRELTAESVVEALEQAIDDLEGTSLGLDLAPITEVRAMAGRVVELRLSGASPYMLNILAQPELGLTSGEGETGPMTMERDGLIARLAMRPPEQRGLPEDETWEEDVIPVTLRAVAARQAIALFEAGEVELVLGGDIGALPLADTGPLALGTVRLDPGIGLFGLQVRRGNGVLSTPETREAIAMAIDRDALLDGFGIGEWDSSTRIVPPGLAGGGGNAAARWPGLSIEARRDEAASRIAAWRSANAPEAGEDEDSEAPERGTRGITLSLALGDDPGDDQLLEELAAQLATIGIMLERADSVAAADLVLIDRTARYASPTWFLNQFACSLRRGLCSDVADDLVEQANAERDGGAQAALLAEAEAALTAENVYIPIGSPLRWSLLRGSVNGHVANGWAFHPLPDMAVIPR